MILSLINCTSAAGILSALSATPFTMSRVLRRWRGLVLTITTLAVLEVLGTLGHRIPNPAPVYLLAVVAAAFDGGRIVGLVSATATLGYAAWFFSVPGSLLTFAPGNLHRVATLAVVTPVMALMVGALRERAGRAAAADREAVFLRERLAERAREEALLRTALAEREALLLELGHRVGNAMQTVSALVALAERDATVAVGTDPDAARRALRILAERVGQLCLVQGMLLRQKTKAAGRDEHEDGPAIVDAATYLGAVARRSRVGHGVEPRVGLHLDLEPMHLLAADAAPLGLLLHEALSNVFGDVSRSGGQPSATLPEVAVELRREPNGETRLVVENWGDSEVAPRPGSVRARLVAALVRQIGGVIEIGAGSKGRAGTRLSVIAPLVQSAHRP